MAWGTGRLGYGVRPKSFDFFQEERDANVGIFHQPAPNYSGDGYDWVKQAISEAQIQQERREREELQRANDLEEAMILSRQMPGSLGDRIERDPYMQRTAQRWGLDLRSEETYRALETDWMAAREAADWEAKYWHPNDPLFVGPRAMDLRKEFRQDPLEWLTHQQANPDVLVEHYGLPRNAANQVKLRREAISQGRGTPYEGEKRGATEGAPNPISLYTSEGLRSVGAPDIVADIAGGVAPYLLGAGIGGAIGRGLGAGAGSMAASGAGAAIIGESARASQTINHDSDLLNAIETAQAPVNAIAFGTPAQRLGEQAILKKIGLNATSRFGQQAGAAGVRAGYGAGANVALDAPAVVASDLPTDEKLEALGLSAGIGAVGGGLGPTLQAVKFLPEPVQDAISAVAPSARNAAATYAVSKLILNEDDQTSLEFAVAAAAAGGVKNVPAIRKFATETLPRAIAKAQGREGRVPAMGLGIDDVSDIDPVAAEILGITRPPVMASAGRAPGELRELPPQNEALRPVGEGADLRALSTEQLRERLARADRSLSRAESRLDRAEFHEGEGSQEAIEAQAAYEMLNAEYERIDAEVNRRRVMGDERGNIRADLAARVAAPVAAAGATYAVTDDEKLAAGVGLAAAGGAAMVGRGRRGPTPVPPGTYDMDGIIASARQQASAPRYIEAAIKQIPWIGRAIAGLPNPAALYDNVQKKAVLVASIARENARRMFQNEWAIRKAQEVDELLDPLMRDRGPRLKTPFGHLSLQDVGRAGAELAAPAAGYGAGEVLGLSEDDKKRLIAAGLVGTASLSQSFSLGKFRAMEFQKAKYIGGPTEPPPPKGTYGKVVDIIERPHLYDLSAMSPAARAVVEDVIGGVSKLQELRAQWVAEVNADRAAAGLAPVSMKDANRMYHLWTKGSAKKALGEKYDTGGYRPVPIGGFVGSGLERNLPDTFAEALQQHPKLRIAGNADPRNLLRQQLAELGAMRSDAVFVRALQSTPAAAQQILSDRTQERIKAAEKAGDKALAKALRVQRKAERANEAALRTDGWSSIAGFGDGWLFSPDTQAAVQKLFIDGMKTENPVVRLLDSATTEIRQAAFVSDLSAWSLQGMMMLLESPGTALRNFVPLVGSSLLGPRYAERWLLNHADLVRDFERSGGILQRETEGTEKGIRTLADFPGIRSIEQRGFGAYLPIHRVLTFQNERNINSFIQHMPKPVRNVFGSDVALAGLNMAKYGGLGFAAYSLASQDDLSNFEKLIAIAAAGGVAALGAKTVEAKLGSQLYKRLNPYNQREVDIRSAKTANRTSGVFNKAQLGISNQQAQAERIFMFRSPALFRNMATIVKLAAFHPGPEGAQARFYLARTFFLTAGLMGAAKLAAGQEESFDPEDPNSVLHPANLSRGNFGSAGKVSPSNPYLSLVRAISHKTPIEGHPEGGEWSLRSMLSGLGSFLQVRSPDVAGPVFWENAWGAMAPAVNPPEFENEQGVRREKSSLERATAAIMSGKPGEILEEIGGRFVPVAVRDVAGTGNLGFLNTGTGDIKFDLGSVDLPAVGNVDLRADTTVGLNLERNPDINSPMERLLGTIVPVAGGNYSPETRAQERNRRVDAAIREQFPQTTDSNLNGRIDLGDLDNQQRRRFNATPMGQELAAFGEETQALRGPQEPSQIDIYLQTHATERDRHVQALQGLEQAILNGSLTKAQYRDAYGEEQRAHIARKKQIDLAAEAQYAQDKKPVFDPATGESHAMSVPQYLSRSMKPNDKAVDDYYGLFDKALGPNGKIDFDKLEQMQAAHKANLPAEQRAYLETHLADVKARGVTNSKGEVVALPTLQQFETLKDKAAPFWEVRETEFAKLQARDKFFQQFENYNDFRNEIRAVATANGIQESDVIGLLSRRHPWLKRYDMAVTRAQRQMRGADLDLDMGLEDFYARPSVNWMARIARQYGDNSYDTRGARLARMQGPSRTQQIAFARRYARQAPQSRGASLLAAFGS